MYLCFPPCPQHGAYLLIFFIFILTGEPLPLDYDSDCDPYDIVGREIKIKWSRNEFYGGRVSHYSPRSGRHHVRYDDGDERDHYLKERTYFFPPVATTRGGNGNGSGGEGEEEGRIASGARR